MGPRNLYKIQQLMEMYRSSYVSMYYVGGISSYSRVFILYIITHPTYMHSKIDRQTDR